jgi:hydrogenase maturation protease
MTRILVAGIGNIFNGDDAFGSEIARRLSKASLPESVTLIDFGIRGIDLTYALLEDYTAAILIDAAQRGEPAGTVSIVEPYRKLLEAPSPQDLMLSPHELDPAKVLRLVAALGGTCTRVVLVACEPLTLGGDEGVIGLSEPVMAAFGVAEATVRELVCEIMATDARPPTECRQQLLGEGASQ